MDKKASSQPPLPQTRVRIAEQRATRLVVSRSNCHIYAQIIAPEGDRVLASASTLEADVRKDGKSGGNKAAAEARGQAHRREGEVARHRGGRVRPFRFPLPWPRQGAGRSRPRRRPQVLRQSIMAQQRSGQTAISSRTIAATACARR